jgi:hypothetical protein
MICHVGGRRVGRLGSMQAGQGRGRPAIFSLHVIAHTACHCGVRFGWNQTATVRAFLAVGAPMAKSGAK